MDIERPHRSSSSSNNNSSELFICFTSRLSSSSTSSMKISSKSILSPGRPREPTSQISLSTSLSRRLRSNGSMKGGQASPMFPAQGQGKKRGGAFENPEPSSPKVTCIGQVRVKTKKQGRKMRTRSKRRSGEISFRRPESGSNSHVDLQQQQQQQPQQAEHRNQRWVHLPMTICEALRALGTDLNCFLPCRSPCMAGSQKEKAEKAASGGGSGGNNGCGAVFARWLVSVQDGDGKGKEIELVVGGGVEEEEEEEVEERRRSYRRHVFEEIEFKEDGMMKDEARVSICVPPKNALLLMRCRSDPVRMAALSNKFWEPPLVPTEAEEVEESAEENEKVGLNAEHVKDSSTAAVQEIVVSSAESEGQTEVDEQKLIREISMEEFEDAQDIDTTQVVNLEDEGGGGDDIVQQRNSTVSCVEEQDLVEQENAEEMNPENGIVQEDDEEAKLDVEQEVEVTFVEIEESAASVQVQEVDQGSEFLQAGQDLEEEEEELTVQEEELKEEMQETIAVAAAEEPEPPEEEETTTRERSESEDRRNQEGQMGYRIKERTESSQPLLPDCLLLMMCEPKLSMEVSKETWVCSTDFIRSLPHHHHSKPVKQKQAPQDEPKKKRNSVDCEPAPHRNKTLLLQPARSSCSYPARPPRAGGTESMSNMIERKLVGAKAGGGGYEPLVLKRCKSEPMRTANKLAAGEPCFWKNRKLEPHRPAAVGIGAAGVGVGG